MKRIVLFVASCCAVLSIGVAGAYFTSQAQVPENMLKAGEVVVSTEPTSAAISMEALAPGVTVTKPISVVNSGGLPLNFVVTAAKKAGITEFYEALQSRVTCDGTLLYEGPLTALKTAPMPLSAGARAQLQVSMSLPATAGNELAGDYAKITLYIDAEQVH